ncbi:MAG TPA: class I SAM-dependent methyltransferase [Caulobacteraceae bacterium]|nr:class I SAM-dependent methyltransferase [Caulobacteraceae bacterium]
MAADIASFVGDIPGHYDRGLGPVIFEGFGEAMARRAATLSPADALELAAGTGIVSRRLRNHLPAGARLTVTDLNPPMLEVARAKFAADEAVTFQPADACDLPFADGAFDLIVCQFGVMFFPDKAKGFAEAFRVLRPGGRYVFSTWDSQRNNRFGAVAQAVVNAQFPADPPRFYDIPFSYHALDQARADVEAAGFVDFSVEVSRIESQVADLDAFTDGLVFGNPLIGQMRERGAVDEARLQADMSRAVVKAFGDPARLSLQALFFAATRP